MKRVISYLVLHVVLEKLVSSSGDRMMIVKIFHKYIFFFLYIYIVAFVELDGLFKNFFTQIDHATKSIMENRIILKFSIKMFDCS